MAGNGFGTMWCLGMWGLECVHGRAETVGQGCVDGRCISVSGVRMMFILYCVVFFFLEAGGCLVNLHGRDSFVALLCTCDMACPLCKRCLLSTQGDNMPSC